MKVLLVLTITILVAAVFAFLRADIVAGFSAIVHRVQQAVSPTEPATMLLFGGVLLGVGFALRRYAIRS